MVEFVVCQDRAKIYPCTATSYFNAKTVIYNGVDVGESLYIDRHYLATYESIEQLYAELRHIHNSEEEIYGVSGYSDWHFTIDELMGRSFYNGKNI